jgi:alpha-L-fucosidase 2
MIFNKLNLSLLCFVLFMITPGCGNTNGDPPLELWYRQPAEIWEEALPLGNGRLGAMVYGDPENEHLQFNEETLWDCGPRDYQREGAYEWLDEIRKLLFDGKQDEAEELAGEVFMGTRAYGNETPEYEADYQPFGDLKIHFPGHDSYTDYRRSLNLSDAVALVSYRVGKTTFTREYFISHPDNVLVARFASDGKHRITFTASLVTLHPTHQLKQIDEHSIALSLNIEDGELKGSAWLTIETKEGTIKVTPENILVEGADEAVLKLVAATSFIDYKDISADPESRCRSLLEQAAGKTFRELKQIHINDYQSLFNRFSIDLGGHETRSVPTDERLSDNINKPDNDLVALYLQYGRYLLISSSRKGTGPPNLQGIWNDKPDPPWGSKYTTNINCEMNFWPAEPLNLAGCHSTIFDMIGELAVEGRKTAKAHYNARGWVLHHNTDLWRGTAPINASNHGIWVTGGAWLCHHLWDHYLYSCDTAFLRETAYPAIKGSALFFVDFLTEDPQTGYLISTPSNSPENGGLVAGPSMDHQIIRSLFKIVLQCNEILNSDHDFATVVRQKLDSIAPDQIGRYGQLQEWLTDIDDTTNHHRHVSHLWGVHPGMEITWDSTPELMSAARQSLIYRGDAGTGWSLAWKINLWARFLDGDHAFKMIQMLLNPALAENRRSSGGTYPNLFDAHPPFQIDGNFGGAAGIAEMLMQSHQGYIHLLPALPEQWPEGRINGLRARGGFEINMKWKNGEIIDLQIKSIAGNILRIKYGEKYMVMETMAGEVLSLGSL